MRTLGHGAGLLLAASAAHAEAPAVQAAAAGKAATLSEVVVTAEKPPQPGAVIGEIPPELQLSPADIQSYGVSNIADLLNELAPEIRSDRGRGGEGPVVLLNGRRISGFNEIRDLPTEAILRVDILPEEVALKYGYSANQRVVNIVLQPHFRAVTVEAGGGAPTAGGQASGQAELGVFRIADDHRAHIDVKYQASSALTEAERDLIPLSSGQAFDLLGNVRSAPPGGEIDPALSALLGQPVTIAGVPPGADGRALTLADFAPTAGVANASSVGRFRTLLPQARQFSANGVYSHPIFAGISATVNATFEANSSDALLGLPGLALQVPAGDPFSPFNQPVEVDRYVAGLGPLTQSTDGWTGHLGTTFNRDAGKWRLSLTGAYDHADSKTESDTGVDVVPLQSLLDARSPALDPFGVLPANLLAMRAQNTAHSTSDTGNAQFLATGPLLTVPAGQVRTSLRIGVTAGDFSSDSQRLGLSQSVDLSRNSLNAQANFDVPLTSRRQGFLPLFGELSANFNVAAEQVSDFGTLETVGYGLNWRPSPKLTLIVSHTHDQNAPSVQQLGNPVVVTAGTRIFDYTTGQTVDVTSVTGGNPALSADSRDVLKLGATWKPFTARELTITANYIDSSIKNPIVTFPAASAEIEAAFPERFIRDADGDLTLVDYRPVNFASQSRRELRWGFNYSKPIGPQTQPQRGRGPGGRLPGQTSLANGPPSDGDSPAPRPDAGAGDAPPGGGFAGPGPGGGGGFRGGGPGGRGGGRGGGQDGRLQFAVYHTVYFEDEYLVRPGGPVLDFLNGAAAGNGGGQPRNEVEAQLGVAERGMGVRLSADWLSGTTVIGAPGSATGNLRFSDIGKINLRFFADLGQQKTLVEKAPFLKGARVTLGITNLFDAKVKVRDANGDTPLSYQPDYIDPQGRVIRLSFRKLFL
ncbi:MAG: TonB-dependent receptor [Phenylobacterium sp.]